MDRNATIEPIEGVEATTSLSALFVDFENVFYSLTDGEKLGRDPALSATMDILAELRGRLRDEGYALVVERSYADWEQLPATEKLNGT